MAKKEKVEAPKAIDTFGDFEFINQQKYDRAVGAIGADDKAALLAEYDKLGGFIRYQGNKVINGAFWDRKKNTRVENPQPKILRQQAAVVEEVIEVPTKKGKKAEDAE